MKITGQLKTLLPTAFGLALLILDGRTAVEGARSGLEVCLQSVLPSLFPFIFLSSILTTSLLSGDFKGCRILCRLYGIPQGTEGILLSGLIGGYPVGAKCIGEAVSRGQLFTAEAERMLVFCNAAGPAFIFGILGSIFPQPWIPWCLWGIHLLSGLYMARLQPYATWRVSSNNSVSNHSVTQRLRQSVVVMGEICGWIILMRTGIAFAKKWGLQYLPKPFEVFVTGILELTNGCLMLSAVENTGLRFLICSALLSFGGLCVALQTSSVSSGVRQRHYLPGKCIQAIFSFLVAYIVQYLFFDVAQKVHLPWLFFAALSVCSGIYIYSRAKQKKSCGNLESLGV